jgi:hypothetical protein
MVFLRPLLSTLLLASAALAHPLTSRAALPTCTQTTSNCFTHPGIYHSCTSLNRIQSQISAGLSPFTDALTSIISKCNFLKSSTWSMSGPYAEVIWAGDDGHNIPLQTDGKAAYIMTLGWYATGNSTWLDRSLTIIRAWSTTLNYLNDQIQGGEGMAYMTAAAEILRASPASGWTSTDTANYLAMFERIRAQPWTDNDGLSGAAFFMNQGAYGNSAVMALAVFAEDAELYNTMVHQATVGDHPNITLDYAISIQISAKPDYYGQVTEMGRDQGHPMGTLRAVSYMGLTALIQGKIRGVQTNFFTHNNTRLIAGWEYWATYNGGEDVPWEERVVRPGSGEVWTVVSETSRGSDYNNGKSPVEAIGVGYHQYFRMGLASRMPKYMAYLEGLGLGFDTFEFGDAKSVAALGL